MKTQVATTLKRNTRKILTEVVKDKSPVVITQRGVPAAYLVDAASYEALQKRVQLLEGIACGEQAVRQRRTSTHSQAKRRLKRWLE
jgi:prevent-host-death family protein